jgi:hypothetical protein
LDRSIEHKETTLSTNSSFIDLSAVACAGMDEASHSSFERLADSNVDQPDRSSTDPGAAADNDEVANTSSVVEVLSRYFFWKPIDATAHSFASDTEPPDQLQEPKMCSLEDHDNPEKDASSEPSLDELLTIMESKD